MIQTMKMALKSISGNVMRTFLTMLGIIIGVVALVVLVSLVNGATGSVTEAVSDLGSDLISVTVSDDKGNPIKLDTISEWSLSDEIGQIAPVSTVSATVKYDTESDSITLYGTTPSYMDVEKLTLLLGRFLKTTDVENNNYVCVINETTANDLIGYVDCVGKEISINGMKFTVAGVLDDDEESLTSIFMSGMKIAYIPYTTLVRLSSSVSGDITDFTLSAAPDGDIDKANEAITELLLKRFEDDEDAFDITSQNILEEAIDNITSILTVLLGGIAAISLLVGGIGIMNIMLVTVTERTREIGIRKAIGAKRGVILRQFLLEAIVLCMMGCAAGIFASWVILSLATVIVSSLSITFALNIQVVLLAIAFCFAIGIIFGLYPANKAAKMKPIDALHYIG